MMFQFNTQQRSWLLEIINPGDNQENIYKMEIIRLADLRGLPVYNFDISYNDGIMVSTLELGCGIVRTRANNRFTGWWKSEVTEKF